MSAEVEFLVEIWDAVRDFVPVAKRPDVALRIMRAASEYGFEKNDLAEVTDEEEDLADAFEDIFHDDEETNPHDDHDE